MMARIVAHMGAEGRDRMVIVLLLLQVQIRKAGRRRSTVSIGRTSTLLQPRDTPYPMVVILAVIEAEAEVEAMDVIMGTEADMQKTPR